LPRSKPQLTPNLTADPNIRRKKVRTPDVAWIR
jgi:hypothetical protein